MQGGTWLAGANGSQVRADDFDGLPRQTEATHASASAQVIAGPTLTLPLVMSPACAAARKSGQDVKDVAQLVERELVE